MSHDSTGYSRGGRGRGRGGSGGGLANANGFVSQGLGQQQQQQGTQQQGQQQQGNDTAIPMMGPTRRPFAASTNTSTNASSGGGANNTALPQAPAHHQHQHQHHGHQHGGGQQGAYFGGGPSRRGGGVDGFHGRTMATPPPQQQQQQQQGTPNVGGSYATSSQTSPSATTRSRRAGSIGNSPAPASTNSFGGGSGPSAGGGVSSYQSTAAAAAPPSSSLFSTSKASAHSTTNMHTNNNNNTSGTTNNTNSDMLLSVMDMGLDFRSYQGFADPSTGRPVVGNIVTFAAEKVPDVFQPTVGLLVTMLHMYSVSRTSEAARVWINAYETVQRLFLEQNSNPTTNQHATTSLSASFSSQPSAAAIGGRGGSTAAADNAQGGGVKDTNAIRHAEEAVRMITQYESSPQPHHPDHRLCERLLVLLDHQSGVRGGGGPGAQQLPSQRRVPQAPKATFCNLHLSDHKCHQDFSCNQVHLHQVGSVKHRIEYHSRLVQCLLGNRMGPEEVDQRLRDSLFYAKFGNKVTLRCHDGSWVQFFKTLYTPARLDLALRKTHLGSVKLQDGGGGGGGRQQQGSKPMDLPTPEAEVKAYLDEGCREVYTALEQKLKEQQAAQQQAAATALAAKSQQVAAAAFARKQQQVQPATTVEQAAQTADVAATGARAPSAGGSGGVNVMQILTTSMAANAKSSASKSGSNANTPSLGSAQPQQVILATNVHNPPTSANIMTTTAATSAGGTTTIGNHIDTPESTPAKAFQLTPSNMIPWASSVNSNIPMSMIPPSSAAVASRVGAVGEARMASSSGAAAAGAPSSSYRYKYRDDDDDDEEDDGGYLVREYVRLTGISEKEQRANEALLSALQAGAGHTSGASNGQSTSAPVTPESFTPLMHEVQMRRFASESTADGDWTR